MYFKHFENIYLKKVFSGKQNEVVKYEILKNAIQKKKSFANGNISILDEAFHILVIPSTASTMQ